jgi:hypothetical protein
MQIAAERGSAQGEAGVKIADVWGEVYASAIKGHGAGLDGAQPTFEIEDEDSSGAFEERFVRPDDGLLMVEPCGDMLFITGGKGSWDPGSPSTTGDTLSSRKLVRVKKKRAR